MTGENLGSVGAGSARHAGSAAINVVGGRDLEVASFDVSGAQPVEDTSGQRAFPDSLNSLASANPANLRVFEWSQDPGHQRGRPGNIIISHDSDLGSDLGQSFANLETLVGDWGRVDLDVRMRETSSELLQGSVFLSCGDEHQDVGVAGNDAEQRRAKLLKDIVNGGNDDSDIVSSEGRLGGDGLRLVGPVADTVDKETSVPMEPKGDEEVHPSAGRPAKAETRPKDIHDGGHNDALL